MEAKDIELGQTYLRTDSAECVAAFVAKMIHAVNAKVIIGDSTFDDCIKLSSTAVHAKWLEPVDYSTWYVWPDGLPQHWSDMSVYDLAAYGYSPSSGGPQSARYLAWNAECDHHGLHYHAASDEAAELEEDEREAGRITAHTTDDELILMVRDHFRQRADLVEPTELPVQYGEQLCGNCGEVMDIAGVVAGCEWCATCWSHSKWLLRRDANAELSESVHDMQQPPSPNRINAFAGVCALPECYSPGDVRRKLEQLGEVSSVGTGGRTWRITRGALFGLTVMARESVWSARLMNDHVEMSSGSLSGLLNDALARFDELVQWSRPVFNEGTEPVTEPAERVLRYIGTGHLKNL